MCTGSGTAPGSVAEALRMAHASMDYLNGRGAADLEAAGCGDVLRSLGGIQAKFTAAHASVLLPGSLPLWTAVIAAWFRYPRATCAPAMYNSPGTPTGTGTSRSSSTYNDMSGMGTPMTLPASLLRSAFRITR